ncbi:MAG: hypothetical protein ACRYG8_27240, partial [Janthinobacterium lividum]
TGVAASVLTVRPFNQSWIDATVARQPWQYPSNRGSFGMAPTNAVFSQTNIKREAEFGAAAGCRSRSLISRNLFPNRFSRNDTFGMRKQEFFSLLGNRSMTAFGLPPLSC